MFGATPFHSKENGHFRSIAEKGRDLDPQDLSSCASELMYRTFTKNKSSELKGNSAKVFLVGKIENTKTF